jgi:hypothetical protein
MEINMGQTILQKIKAEKTKILSEMRRDWNKKEFPIIRSNEWWVAYPESTDKNGNHDIEYSFQDGPVTLRALMEIVEELKSNGIKEAYYETRYDYFSSGYDRLTRYADIGYDYEAGEHVTVDLAPLFQ